MGSGEWEQPFSVKGKAEKATAYSSVILASVTLTAIALPISAVTALIPANCTLREKCGKLG
jgi:hypothetical protein